MAGYQSGYVSAVLLKQFCGFSTEMFYIIGKIVWTIGQEDMIEYECTRDFEPVEKYSISKEISENDLSML